MDLVDLAQQALGDRVELAGGDRATALRPAEPLQRLAQHPDVLGNLVPVARIGVAHRLENLLEARPPITRFRWEIGAAPERLAVVC